MSLNGSFAVDIYVGICYNICMTYISTPVTYEEKDMKISRYRFTLISPFPSIEAEVVDESGGKSYVDISICGTDPIEEVDGDSVLVYNCPLDKVDFNSADDYCRNDTGAFVPAIRALTGIWNRLSETERVKGIPARYGEVGPWVACALPC